MYVDNPNGDINDEYNTFTAVAFANLMLTFLHLATDMQILLFS